MRQLQLQLLPIIIFTLLLLSLMTSAFQQNHSIESRGGVSREQRRRSRFGIGGVIVHNSSAASEFESELEAELMSSWQQDMNDFSPRFVASEWMNMDEDSSCDLFPVIDNTQLIPGITIRGRRTAAQTQAQEASSSSSSVVDVMKYLNIKRV